MEHMAVGWIFFFGVIISAMVLCLIWIATDSSRGQATSEPPPSEPSWKLREKEEEDRSKARREERRIENEKDRERLQPEVNRFNEEALALSKKPLWELPDYYNVVSLVGLGNVIELSSLGRTFARIPVKYIASIEVTTRGQKQQLLYHTSAHYYDDGRYFKANGESVITITTLAGMKYVITVPWTLTDIILDKLVNDWKSDG